MNKKAVKIIEEKQKKDVNFLYNVDVDFISLVKYGANRIPFKIIKSDNIGGAGNLIVVQSILVPKTQNFESVASEKGLEWLNNAKKEEIEDYKEYSKYIQTSVEKFDKNSLGMIKLNDNGVWAVVGKVEKMENDFLVLGKKDIEKYMEIPIPAGQIPVASIAREPVQISFSEMFEKELFTFLDIVKSTLSQTNSDPNRRKKSILGALDSFKDFVVMGLDVINGKQDKQKEDIDLKQLKEKVQKISDALKNLEKGGNEEMSLFKDKDEFKKEVVEIIAATLAKKEKAEKEKADKEKADKEKADKEKEDKDKADKEKAEKEKDAGVDTNDLKKQLEDLNQKISKIVEKQETLENQLDTDPAANAGDGEQTIEKQDKKKSVFAGLLTKE